MPSLDNQSTVVLLERTIMMFPSRPKGSPSRNSSLSKSRSWASTRRSDTSKGASSQEKLFFMIICAFSVISVTLNVLHTQGIQGHDMIRITGNDKGTATDQVIKGGKFKKHLHHPALAKHDLPKKKGGSKKERRERHGKISVKDGAMGNSDAIDGKGRYELEDSEKDDNQHSIGGLSCSAYGGPDDEIATKEMVYWSDIKSDAQYISPFKKHNDVKGGETQYMTFEPDGGGWNNIRMAMETVVVMAHAMGRTLVLPPAQGMYLLRKDKGKCIIGHPRITR